jgi:hypothetical protein
LKGLILFACLALGACATPRLYSEAELGTLAESCGYSLGEVVQDESEKRLLLVLTAAVTSQTEQRCIYRWARPRHLHVVYAQVEQGS